jgi:DNA-binding MarR family transcriptional regulator
MPAPRNSVADAPAIYADRSQATAPVKDRDVIISESIGFVVSSTARILGRVLNEVLSPHGVASAQWTVLLHLWNREGVHQRALSSAIGIDEATLTRTIDRLVRDKLVVRKTDPQSGRRQMILLTSRGKALKADLVPVVQALNRRALKHLSEKDFQELIRLLSLVRAGVDASD